MTVKDRLEYYNEAGHTNRHSRSCWAGASKYRVWAVGGAVYKTAAVAGGWRGMVMRKPLTKCQKPKKSKQDIDQQTNGPTDKHGPKQ